MAYLLRLADAPAYPRPHKPSRLLRGSCDRRAHLRSLERQPKKVPCPFDRFGSRPEVGPPPSRAAVLACLFALLAQTLSPPGAPTRNSASAPSYGPSVCWSALWAVRSSRYLASSKSCRRPLASFICRNTLRPASCTGQPSRTLVSRDIQAVSKAAPGTHLKILNAGAFERPKTDQLSRGKDSSGCSIDQAWFTRSQRA